MPYELETDEGLVVIDRRIPAIKGYVKAGKWKQHFKKIKEVLNIR